MIGQSQRLLNGAAFSAAIAFAVMVHGRVQAVQVQAVEAARIGVPDGDERYQFFDVAGAIVLAGDTIAVADGGTQVIRYYDPAGRFVRSTGGKGEGPGEFRRLSALALWRDSLFAFDHDLARITVLDHRGRTARTFRIRFDDSRPLQNVLGIIEPGVIIGEVGEVVTAATESTVRRDSFTVAAYDLEGRFVRLIGRFNGTEQLVLVRSGAGVVSVMKRLLPNGRTTFRRASATNVVVAETEAYAVKFYDATGRLAGSIMESREPVRLSSGERAAMRADLSSAPDENARREIERILRSISLPDTKPAWDDLAIASDGRVFVREPGEAAAAQANWTVFESGGRQLGTLTLPGSARLLDVRGSTLLAIETDSTAVEQIVRYVLDGGGRRTGTK